ncbi:MAG: S-layer homology domain-containing protein, partial [Butyricicoccus sp.]|nr:S-layer homology domain-containing protein [Butyricicoccus sp.]
YKWKRMLAAALSVLMVLPATIWTAAAGDEGEEEETSPIVATTTVRFDQASHVKAPQGATLNAGEAKGFDIAIEQKDYRLSEINLQITKTVVSEPTTQTITLNKDNTTGNTLGVEAKVDNWPKDNGGCKLTITAPKSESSDNASLDGTGTVAFDVTVAFKTETRDDFTASIPDASHATVTGTNSNNTYYDGDDVKLTITPEKGYQLKQLVLSNGTEQTTVTGSATWKEWTVTWNATGETTITTQAIHSDLSVQSLVEEIPETYQVKINVDDGLKLERPSSSSTTVTEGNTLSIRVSTRAGYTFGDLTVQYGKNYASWATGQTYLVMGNDRALVTEDEDELSFTLPSIYYDTTLTFTSGYDEDNIPIVIDEGSHINIDTDCDDTIPRGDDAEFYISTTSDRYSVRRITLKVGDEEATVDPADGEIRVGRRNYEIEDAGDGEYILYVDRITEPVKVSATSTSTGTVSRPTLTIQSSSNMKITKSVSSNRIDAGDDVMFYFTPNTNYQIDEITVKIGDNSRTVGADKTSIKVGGTTYQVRRSSTGVVTLYLTDLEENVTVSGRAYYSRDPVQPTNEVRLNTSSRSAFMSGYTDGTFRPENNMTRAEAVVMLYRLCDISSSVSVTGSTYRDVVSGSWYVQAVNTFEAAGILDSTTYFYPDQAITRGDFVEIIYRLMGSPSVSSSSPSFTDTNNSAVRYTASRGWVSGYNDGSFRPYSGLARSEAASLVTRMLGRTSGGAAIYYSDVPATYWAYKAIQLASSYV